VPVVDRHYGRNARMGRLSTPPNTHSDEVIASGRFTRSRAALDVILNTGADMNAPDASGP
jgi:hypothetical protein